jgi:hypothetical protein
MEGKTTTTMHRLSSNATLFLKIFLPVFWTSVLTGVTLVTWFGEESKFGGLPLTSLRWATLFTLVMGVTLFLLIFWPLKRVESDGEKVYVSNYFRTAFYSWGQDVESYHEFRFLFFKIAIIELNGVGSFGRKMRFVPSKKLVKAFREQFPGVMPEAE